MPFIYMENILHFSSNNGVVLLPGALDLSAVDLQTTVSLAFSHLDDEVLLEACCGGRGLIADRISLQYEEYLKLVQEFRVQAAGKNAKREHTKKRRGYFNSQRCTILLAMLESGVPYTCAHPECPIHANLTVDHVVPLSRGGTDELKNLQFLCRSHNSSKSDAERSW